MKTNLNLVSEEVSKRIVNKGFDYEVLYKFVDGQPIKMDDWQVVDHPCPSYNTVRQWLSEQFDYEVFVTRIGIQTLPDAGYGMVIYIPDDNSFKTDLCIYKNYEECLEHGVIHALDIIDGEVIPVHPDK